jgi:4-aminobutyrate aminotransferase
MVAAEFAKDPETKEIYPELRDAIIQEAFGRGLLLLGCGTSTIRFIPALNVSREFVDKGLLIFEEALQEAEDALQR